MKPTGSVFVSAVGLQEFIPSPPHAFLIAGRSPLCFGVPSGDLVRAEHVQKCPTGVIATVDGEGRLILETRRVDDSRVGATDEIYVLVW